MSELTAHQAAVLETLLGFTCTSDVEHARAVLESVGWDVQRAADAMFNGQDEPVITSHTDGAFTVKKEEQMDVEPSAPAPPSPNENKPPQPVKKSDSQTYIDIRVKPEPGLDEPRAGWASAAPPPPNTPKKVQVKPEPGASVATPKREPLAPYDANAVLPGGTPKKTRLEPATSFVKYAGAHEIAAEYTPEKAMSNGLAMVNALAESVGKLELGSRLRKDVWLKEMDSLKSQGVPRTLIAICGGTGTGKSSCLNAVLGDNIVPTSGMRACTAVVTEISYHDKKTIEADVTFLSRQEWRDEIEVLLTDMIDENGQLRRLSDLNNEAGVAWHKLHAVCPTLIPEVIVQMTPDQLIDRDQRVAKALGTTKKISCANSRAFAREIGKYIDSKEKKKGKKGEKKTEEERRKENEPAMWPLIKQVRVRCKSRALETGAILVDLPGTQDANTARGAIAKDYMKRCQAIWILAPITRAVDDRTAKELLGDAFKSQLMMDGNYASSCVTFVATKTDDLSCNEIARALNLDEDPELCRIEDAITDANRVLKDQRKIKEAADDDIKAVAKEITAKDEWLDKLKDYLETVQAGGQIAKSETQPKTEKKEKKKGKGKKRKSSGKGRKGGAKRRKTGDGDMGDFIADDDEEDEDEEGSGSDNDNDSGSESEKEKGDDSASEAEDDDDDDDDEDADSDDSSSSSSRKKKSKSKSKSRLTKRKRGSDDEDVDMDDEEDAEMRDDPDADKSDDEPEEVEYATEEYLKEEIKRIRDEIKALRERKKKMGDGRRAAVSAISEAKKNLARLQREKNCLCSKARNAYSRDALKIDFREGLKEIDEAAALERDPDNFDPTVQLRDYDAIDLPVFTVSSRDYVRITGQVQGDGDPTVFTSVEDTMIPALQDWCHTLTDASRARTAQQYLRHIATFANSVRTYVQSINDVSVVDRVHLKEKWASDDLSTDDEEDSEEDDDESDGSSDVNMGLGQYNRLLQRSLGMGGMGGMKLASKKLARQLGYNAAPPAPAAAKPARQSRKIPAKKGITDLLIDDFERVVDESVKDLQKRMNDGLEDKCKTGAEKANAAALETSDTFAASMHWATYRATLRRLGANRHYDLNADLCQPMTSSIASSWSAVFEQDLFGMFEKKGIHAIQNMLDRVEQSAAPGLREKCRAQTDVALREAKTAMANIVAQVDDAMKTLQKELSRMLAPKIRDELVEGYNRAMEERGIGSVKRQKDAFHDFIDRVREDVFDGGADLLLDGLKDAARQVGDIMDRELENLAKKVEVALSVLWDVASDSQKQVAARMETLERVVEILKQLSYWSDAAAMAAAAAEA